MIARHLRTAAEWLRNRRSRAVHREQAAKWQASADRYFAAASRHIAHTQGKVVLYCLSFRDAERAEAHRALASNPPDHKRAQERDAEAEWWQGRADQHGMNDTNDTNKMRAWVKEGVQCVI